MFQSVAIVDLYWRQFRLFLLPRSYLPLGCVVNNFAQQIKRKKQEAAAQIKSSASATSRERQPGSFFFARLRSEAIIDRTGVQHNSSTRGFSGVMW